MNYYGNNLEKGDRRESRSYRSILFICLLLAAVTILVFGQVAGHDFLNFDDDLYVTENPHIQDGLTLQSVKWAFTTTYVAFWHPLTWLSHELDIQLFGLKAGMHHLSSLLLHIGSTVLLFLLLFRATGAKWPSAACAALFAIHPLHVESVAWAAERKDTLSTFFWMLTMWCYVWYVERPVLKRYILVLSAFILGLMAKPMLVTLPFVLLLFDWWPLDRFKERSSIRNLILEKVPLLLLACGAAAIAFFAQKSLNVIGSFDQYSLGMRIANACKAYVFYMIKTVWPSNLAVPYPHYGMPPVWQATGAALILILISVIAVRSFSRRPYLLIGWLWYLGTLVPVSGLVQVGDHGMADRYTYVPLVGLFIMVSWGAADILAKWRHKNKKQVAAVSIGAAFTGLMIISWIQTGHWKNTITLFKQTIDAGYSSVKAHNNRGTAFLDAKEYKEAAYHFSETLKIDPKNVKAYNNLGSAMLGLGFPEKAETHLSRAVSLAPDNAAFEYNLGLSRFRQGKIDEAAAHYSRAIELDPELLEPKRDLANILLGKGDSEGAVVHFTEALKISPDDAVMNNNMGNALLAQGKVDESIRYYSEAARLKPYYATYYNLGYAYLVSGRLDEAVHNFKESIKLYPDNAWAHNNLGNALARRGDTEEAIIHYSEALRINPDLEEVRQNLERLQK